MAAPVSAQNPPIGFSLVIFEPMVCTIRQPPEIVPSAIAACADSTTQSGIAGSAPSGPYVKPAKPHAVKTAVMMLIVFWASFPPGPGQEGAPEAESPVRQ